MASSFSNGEYIYTGLEMDTNEANQYLNVALKDFFEKVWDDGGYKPTYSSITFTMTARIGSGVIGSGRMRVHLRTDSTDVVESWIDTGSSSITTSDKNWSKDASDLFGVNDSIFCPKTSKWGSKATAQNTYLRFWGFHLFNPYWYFSFKIKLNDYQKTEHSIMLVNHLGNNTTIKKRHKETYGNSLPTPTKSGYNFVGWKNSAGNIVKSTDVITGTHTLTAQWEPINFTLKYDANGGTGSMNSESVNYLSEYTLTDSLFIGPTYKIDYNLNGATENFETPKYYNRLFTGKWLDVNTNTVYSVGDSIKEKFPVEDGSTVTLKAQWGNALATLPSSQRNYHTFVGWKEGTQTHLEGDIINLSSNINLIAQWEKTQFRIFSKEKDSMELNKVPHIYLQDKKIKKVFIYTPEIGLKEV